MTTTAMAQLSSRIRGTVSQAGEGMLQVALNGGGKELAISLLPTVTAHIVVQAQTDAGGVLTADRVTVGKDGLVPPM